MMSRYLVLVWTVLSLCNTDGIFGETTSHAFFGPYNFIATENPVSLFEVQGAHEVNTFTSGGLYRANINENAGIGTYIRSPVKMGLYVEENGKKIEYFVLTSGTQRTAVNCSWTSTFSLEGKRIENFYFLRLKTKRMISEESCKSYSVTVDARYSETKIIIDTTQVLIEVKVSNNMPPRFMETNPKASIASNFPLFQPILQLDTADRDKHNIGKVYFLLKRQSKYFALNPVNGVLLLKRHLPVGLTQHNLVAYARRWDARLSQKTSDVNTCKITIKVTQVNQYTPLISVSKMDNVKNKANTVAATIIVSDLDVGMNGKIDSFAIISGDEHRHFRLEEIGTDNTVFRLRLFKPSKDSKLRLTFIATDKGNPPKSSTAVYRVNLVDLSSTRIRFSKENYFVNVSEMAPINYTVIQVNPVNLKPSSRYSYSIVQGDPSNRFRMESNTGQIIVAGTLDAETTSVYLLNIELTVAGDITTTTNLHIQIEDFNDHVPKFTTDNHLVEIQEDTALHTSIYKVVAKDGDSGDNGLVSYWLPNSDRFEIHPYTGVISVKRDSDRDSGIPEYAYLVVRAGDSGSPIRRETETMVKVKIKAWNDNAPIVKQNDCAISLSPNTPVGTKLVKIEAIDIDVDTKDQPSFSLTMGNTGSYFAIDSNSGVVTVSKPLIDARSSYSLIVFANDGTYKSLNNAFLQITIDSKKTKEDVSCKDSDAYIKALKRKSEHQVAIVPDEPVIDSRPPRNIHSPRFTDRELVITISEDLEIGSVLTTVKATDNDNGYEGLLNYYIVDGNTNQRFDMDVETGELKSIAQLDREQVPKYELNISAWDLGVARKADFIKVVVVVKDVNDNAPVFEHMVYNIPVSENIPVGSTVLKLVAKDNDEGVNQRITYQLTDDYDQLFFIDYNSGDLIINKHLDFEVKKSYNLKALALDGSSTNQHVGQAEVIINVLDENDNSPIINHVMQDVYVMKDFPMQTPITQVVATDPDSGNGGIVSFTLAKSRGSDLFSITDKTGLLKLKRRLTISVHDVYNLTVVVSDQGQPPLISNAHVNIHIMQRISDEDVQIMSNQGGIIKYSVLENSPAGYQIGQLTNPNRNLERQSSFLFSIVDGTDVSKFDLTDTSGLLTTTESLDHEEFPYYWLTIQVLTQQSRQFHNNIQLLIKVEDENDNYPIFSPPVYESKIPENTQAEEIVVKVSASDLDAEENGRLIYSIITGNSGGHFKINSKTGLITTTKLPVDYEKQKMYQLVVKVTDNGSTPRSSEASLTILIQDENDNRPKFKDNLNIDFIISGTSNIPNNTLLGQVLACDGDQGDNGDLTFTILSGNKDGKLRIDPKSGQLFSNVILHSTDSFQLKLEANDSGNPELSEKTNIDLVVTEQLTLGQNPPTFLKKQVNISLAENTPVGHKIVIMPATDKDNDFPVYFIKSGNEDQRFQLQVNPLDSLELIAELDPAKEYHVVISATDGLYSSEFKLNIKIKDINDHYPVAEMIERIVTVSENVSPGTKVVTVTASDLDSGINAKIRYSFKSAVVSKSLKLFDINENTGEITIKGVLDYEDMRSHVLIVAMTDSAYQPKESTMYVVVNVADVNEWKPEFIKPSYHIVIPENIPRGSDVIKLLAKDKDQGRDAVLKYSITSGNYGFAFTIKPQSGVIQTNKELKASHMSQYTLTVEVRDDGAHGLSATVNVTVVLLTHGHRPGFAKDIFSASMYENQPINTVVESVGFDGLMTFYTIINETACANGFQINPFIGIITTKQIFDAEKVSSCSLRVKAQDGDGYSQESTVKIEIKDLNDNAPRMEEQVFIGYIEENARESTLVLNTEGHPLVIAALDMDVKPNNRKLKYEIINPGMDSYFKLDENTGALLTSKLNLDYEMIHSYTFLVKVNDGGSPFLSDIATVVVHVKNINDVAPVFSKGLYEVIMYLPTYKGVQVATLTASDQDNLGNITFSIKQQDTSSLLTVNPTSGVITIAAPSKASEGWFSAVVEVNDGEITGSANVRVLFKPVPVTALHFPRPSFVAHIRENTSSVQTVFTPFVRGYKIRERITFRLGNPQDTFTIKESTGVIKTIPGVVIDREKISSFYLLIIAKDDSTPPRMAHSLVNVIVDDVNDCTPTFPSPPIFFVVPKSSKIGSTVATVTALDFDDGKNGEIRYELKSDKSKRFGIDARTGALKVLDQLVGIITPAEFTLIIEASDLGEKPLRSEAQVSIRIESGDACIFQKPSYTVELSEDTVVDKVFKRLHSRCPNGRPVFNIISGDNFGQFVCDLNTGELSLASKLDFETTPGYRLTVRAKDSNTGASSMTMVNILVKDVNDNPPTFDGAPYFVRTRENSPAGTRLMRLVSADLDSGENEKRSYEIVHDVSVGSGTFAIDTVTGILSITKRLDYEKDKGFDVTIKVTDHGQPSLSSETLVKVFVTDINDNAPKFQKLQYSATVLNNAGPNHFITRVLATDKDDTDFEKLRYKMVSGRGRSFFHIDANSGVVSLSQVPGLVLGKVYTLKLSVDDGNHTSYAMLDVVVGQTNNHAPVFQTDVMHAQVSENYPADTYVAMVTATDQDSGAFGEVVYGMDSERAAKDFKIDKVSGILTTVKPLDREVISSITILIRATDKGGKSAFCNVKIDIMDENDNQPQFLMPTYTAVVPITRASVGENVARVTAVDLDEGENSDLTYSLVGQISPFVFGINSSSGAITFLRRPREPTYNFYVRVSDKGYLKLRNYAQVHVSVTSLVFQFKRRTYSVAIFESKRGSMIYPKLELIDNNGALVTSDVDYFIEVGSSPQTNKLGTFSITPQGELQISKSLDYETVNSYDLTIRAYRSSFSVYTTVHIELRDENDNTPEFESDLYVVNIPEDSPLGTRVVQVQAHDKDSKENGRVTYEMSVESKRYLTVFAIDEKTGWITTIGDLDRETVSSYILQVNAQDHGKDNPFVNTTRVKIILDDVNDSPPVFSKTVYEASIKEDSPIGTEVLSLNTTDKDINSRIVYYIVNGDRHNHFNIDQNSGKIYVYTELDHELLPRYLLSITASDGAFIASTSVKIEIIDVNDNKPYCKKLNLRVPVLENTTVGTSIATINATDKDKGNNSRIYFSIFNHREKFSVDGSTGVIKLDNILDREKKSSYNFFVSASDGHDACYTNVTIDVIDINDSPPEFTKPRYIKPVPIDAAKNAFLLRVEATDKDIGLNRKVTYAFANATTVQVFAIEKETGIISLQSRLLWRDEEKFVFNVVATDSGVPAISSETTVEIVVSPIMNCSFVKNEYKRDIPEDTNPIYEFETVSVTCSDRFNIGYRIVDGNNEANKLFGIDQNKGTLSLEASLDYEHVRLHIFDVEAFMVKKSGKTILISSTSIKVKVIDRNDNTPAFEQHSYEATVNEDSSKDSFVIDVHASDNDTSETVTYSLIKSVPDAAKFEINSITGMITVQGFLDREKTEQYKLVVRAQDSGNPPLSSNVSVLIKIKDVNDNAPVVEKEIKTLVLTNTAVGAVVLKLTPTDADGPSNSKPFTFSVLSGENNMFKLNASSGELTTERRLLHHNITYSMMIRTTDSGSHPLFVDTSVEITLVKYSLNPPKVRHTTVYVNMLIGNFNGGIIGKVVAHDPDKDGILQFSLREGNAQFSIGLTDGAIRITSLLDRPSYSFVVQVTDGTHKVNAQVTVRAKNITSAVVTNSMGIRIKSKTLSNFVSSSLSPMIAALAEIMSCTVDEVYLWNIQTSPENKLDIVFAIRKLGKQEFFDPSELQEALEAQLTKFQKLSNVVVSSVGIFPCSERRCTQGKVCQNKIKVVNTWSILSSDATTFLSYKNQQESECVCPKGGLDCPIPGYSKCRANPCKSGLQCVDRLTGYECICPKGKNCEKECHGDICHKDTMSFNGNSYIRYSLADDKAKLTSFSVSVRTTKPSGTILSAKGGDDYLILEIVEGKIRVRFNYGSGEGIARIDHVKINDGQWHDVKVIRKERNVRLSLNPGRYMAEDVALGSMRFLNVETDNIIVGGDLRRRSRRSSHEVVLNGYFGCMESPRLNDNDLPLSGSNTMAKAATEGVTSNCSIAVCHPSFCQNDGQCDVIERSGNKVPSCICKPGFTGVDCGEDVNECDLSPCKNSGLCVNSIGSFKCKCMDRNFKGSVCETSVAALSQTSPLGTRELIYIGTTVFVLVIIAIIIACACRCWHKRRKKAKAQGLEHERHELKMKETDEEISINPPPPPPRRGADIDDPPVNRKLGSRAQSWDYSELPEMGLHSKRLSGNFVDLPSKSCDDLGEYSGTNGIPQVPKRPRHISDSQSIPDVPKKPSQYRCSRASSQSSVHSENYGEASEFAEEDLDIIRQATKDIEKLAFKAADFVDTMLGTNCASPPSECDAKSECSEVNELLGVGHLEIYDDNEVDYFIPENDQDSVSVNDSDGETSSMLEKLPDVRHSRGEVLHKESQL